MATEADIWKGVLYGGLGIAGLSLVLEGPPKPRKPNTPTGAPSDTGAPVPSVGGVPDYVRVYLAQRIACQADNGTFPEPGTNQKFLPITPRVYAVREVVTYWVAEIERLTSLDRFPVGVRRLSLLSRPTSIGDAMGPFAVTYNGTVSRDSADALLLAWSRAAPRLLAALSGDAPTLDKDRAQAFWDTIADLAIDVDVDRATPDRATFRDAWGALYDSVLELPGTLGEAARAAANAAVGFTLDALWSLVSPILFSPVGIGAAAVAAYMFRRELTWIYGRLT